MPALADTVYVIEAAEEVFENKIDNEENTTCIVNQNEKLRSKDNTFNFYQISSVIHHAKSIPCYQEVLLLTERHLMGDTGPLSIYLRNNIAKIVRIDLIVKEI